MCSDHDPFYILIMVDLDNMAQEAESFSTFEGSSEDFYVKIYEFIEAAGLDINYYRVRGRKWSGISSLPFEWYRHLGWENPRDKPQIERFVAIFKRAGYLVMSNPFAPQQILFNYGNSKVYWVALSKNTALPLFFSEWEKVKADLSNFEFAPPKAICGWYDTSDLNAGFYRAAPGTKPLMNSLLGQIAYTRETLAEYPHVRYKAINPLDKRALDWAQSLLNSIGSKHQIPFPKPYRGGAPSNPEVKRWAGIVKNMISESNFELENVILTFLTSIVPDKIPNWKGFDEKWTRFMARSHEMVDLNFYINQCHALAKSFDKKIPHHLLSCIFEDGEYEVTTDITLMLDSS